MVCEYCGSTDVDFEKFEKGGEMVHFCSERCNYRWEYQNGLTDPDPEKYPHHDVNWLREQYVRKKKTLAEIGEVSGASAGIIQKWVYRFGLDAERPGHEQWLVDQIVENSNSIPGDSPGDLVDRARRGDLDADEIAELV